MSWLILHDIARWQEKMTALQEERKEKLGDMSDILEKRDSIGKQIQATCNENPGGLFGRILQACTQSLEVLSNCSER